jgi:hypothetical protein
VGSVLADVDGHDFLFHNVADDVGGFEPDGHGHFVSPVATLDLELPHESAQLRRDGGQFCDSCARSKVPSAACATPPMFTEMLPAPVAASPALRSSHWWLRPAVRRRRRWSQKYH